MRHLISLKEVSKDDILEMIDTAWHLKQRRIGEHFANLLPGKTLIMLFQKTSTRTRVSFEAAMTELGGHSIFLDERTTQLPFSDFKDEIRAIMRYGHILLFRALKAEDVMTAADYNQIPVIDGCSEKYHPVQTISDIFTMAEHSGGIEKIKKIAWLGMQNNVSNTLKLACAKLGIKLAVLRIATDPESIDKKLNQQADKSGLIHYSYFIREVLEGADYVHTDTWMNMEHFDSDGKVKQEYIELYKQRQYLFMQFQVNAELIGKYAPQAKIMHCMPCHIGYEISRDGVEHPNSIIFAQAENRLHTQKAIILWLLEKTNLVR